VQPRALYFIPNRLGVQPEDDGLAGRSRIESVVRGSEGTVG
jgi:hypothetical protein